MLNVQTDLLAGIAQCRSTDETRGYLHCMRVEPAPDPETRHGVRLVATDGYVLAVAWDAWGRADAPVSLTLDWRDKNLKTPVKEIGTRRLHWSGNAHEPGFILTNQPQQGEPACYPPEGSTPILAQEQWGTFPDWRRLVSAGGDAKAMHLYGWRSDVIATMARCIQRISNSTKPVGFSFHQSSPVNPALVVAHSYPEVFFMAMPRRAETPTLPGWLDFTKQTAEAA